VIHLPFEPLKLTRHGGAAVTLDVQHRLRISAEAMRELKLSPYQYVVISVDVENKRIGIAKMELAKVPNASAVKIDKRGYLGTKAGKEVVRKLALADGMLPIKFADIGFFDEGGVRWRAFESEKTDYFPPLDRSTD
jgi:hypothetical protein